LWKKEYSNDIFKFLKHKFIKLIIKWVHELNFTLFAFSFPLFEKIIVMLIPCVNMAREIYTHCTNKAPLVSSYSWKDSTCHSMEPWLRSVWPILHVHLQLSSFFFSFFFFSLYLHILQVLCVSWPSLVCLISRRLLQDLSTYIYIINKPMTSHIYFVSQFNTNFAYINKLHNLIWDCYIQESFKCLFNPQKLKFETHYD